jgi:hypothetical protein
MGAESCEKLTREDFVLEKLGRRIRQDVDHPIECLESYTTKME